MGTVFDKKLNDIITFARKKGNCISYYTVIDILKSEDKEFDQEMIAAIMEAIADVQSSDLFGGKWFCRV